MGQMFLLFLPNTKLFGKVGYSYFLKTTIILDSLANNISFDTKIYLFMNTGLFGLLMFQSSLYCTRGLKLTIVP